MHNNDLQNDSTPSIGVTAGCSLSAAASDQALAPDAPAIIAAAHGHGDPSPSNATAKAGRSRGGAPRGNVNAARHGLRGSGFPKGAKADYLEVLRNVSEIRDAYEASHGPAGPYADALLHRIRRALTRDRLAARWLRLEADKLSLEQRLSLTEVMNTAAETIEKCMRQLGLHQPGHTDGSIAGFHQRRKLAKVRKQLASPTIELAASKDPEKPHAASGPAATETTSPALATQSQPTGQASGPDSDLTDRIVPAEATT